eukprot:TRINITY_DN8082_c0_g1_i1.p2 TRINITY_DN8082_c0_g1~~TRINITY_DN8082_c0_g1_i1.p2  ORF type:complete len:296 (+),score=80.58 TRINITY_DN8082_c0_g1_i1:133-1020(+)
MLMRAAVLLACSAATAAHEAEPIWPQVPPGDENSTRPKEYDICALGSCRAFSVSTPTLTFFPAGKEFKGPRPTVLVFPGGGYTYVVYDREGAWVAERFNKLGMHAAVLKYRVPDRGTRSGLPPRWAPLMDAQRAMGIIRARAAEWGVQQNALGVVGFSAGGNLAAHISTRWHERIYAPVDDADRQSCRPDFGMLGYPWHLLDNTNNVSSVRSWLPVAKDTPPQWMMHAANDLTAPVSNSIGWELALRGINASPEPELHVYPEGGHGFGVCDEGQTWEICRWPDVAATWLRAIGLL